MENGLRCTMRVFVSLALIVLFTTATQNAIADVLTGAVVGGKTEVYSSGMSTGCTGDLWGILLPIVLDIDPPNDDVKVEYRAYWWDNRTNSNAPPAYHNFNLYVDYDHSPYGSDSWPATTRAQQSGSHTLSVTINGPDEDKDVNFTWAASVVVSGACMWSDSHSGGFRLR